MAQKVKVLTCHKDQPLESDPGTLLVRGENRLDCRLTSTEELWHAHVHTHSHTQAIDAKKLK